jgi:DNA-binding HxlR family transcriptional regulator
LEQNKIITKECFAEVPPRVEYTLTQKGKDLIPILKSMAAWGGKYAKV